MFSVSLSVDHSSHPYHGKWSHDIYLPYEKRERERERERIIGVCVHMHILKYNASWNLRKGLSYYIKIVLYFAEDPMETFYKCWE